MTKLFSSSKFSVRFELYYLTQCEYKIDYILPLFNRKKIPRKLQDTHNIMMMGNKNILCKIEI